jgi:hypothetical protein
MSAYTGGSSAGRFFADWPAILTDPNDDYWLDGASWLLPFQTEVVKKFGVCFVRPVATIRKGAVCRQNLWSTDDLVFQNLWSTDDLVFEHGSHEH